MMKSARTLFIIAVLLGLVTASLVYVYISNLSGGGAREPRLVQVVVASMELPPRTVLRPDMLTVKEVPVDLVSSEAVVDVREALGRVVKSTIAPGEQVVRTKLFPAGEIPGLPFKIPDNKRAVTIAVNEVIGVAGFIKPGDRVDVLGTFDRGNETVTVAVLQDVEVLAIAQDMTNDLDQEPRVTTTVTLAVTLQQAQKLTLAEERGSLRVALRPVNTFSREVARAITTSDIAGEEKPVVSQTASASASKRTSTSRTRPPARVQVMAVSEEKEEFKTVEVIRGTQRSQVKVKCK